MHISSFLCLNDGVCLSMLPSLLLLIPIQQVLVICVCWFSLGHCQFWNCLHSLCPLFFSIVLCPVSIFHISVFPGLSFSFSCFLSMHFPVWVLCDYLFMPCLFPLFPFLCFLLLLLFASRFSCSLDFCFLFSFCLLFCLIRPGARWGRNCAKLRQLLQLQVLQV